MIGPAVGVVLVPGSILAGADEDPREARSTTRAGMGRCQGRVCGYATAGVLAGLTGRGVTEEDLLATGRRPLAAPVTLGTLAALDGAADDEEVPTA